MMFQLQEFIWVDAESHLCFWWFVKKIASGRCKLSLGLIAGDVWRGGLLIINKQIISVAYNFYESITQAWVLCTYGNHPFCLLETLSILKQKCLVCDKNIHTKQQGVGERNFGFFHQRRSWYIYIYKRIVRGDFFMYFYI